MKKRLLVLLAIFVSAQAMAQTSKFTFPFQGGNQAMAKYFQENTDVPKAVKEGRAIGTVILKFTADENGEVSKIVLYHADDAALLQPLIDVLKKSTHKWVIPEHEKEHDFMIPFSISFNPTGDEGDSAKRLYKSYQSRSPMSTNDQMPLAEVTLLPAVEISYTAN